MKDELAKAKVLDLMSAARELVDLVRDAKVMTAFDEQGNGPFQSLADDHLLGHDGPIRRRAERVRALLLDLERLDP